MLPPSRRTPSMLLLQFPGMAVHCLLNPTLQAPSQLRSKVLGDGQGNAKRASSGSFPLQMLYQGHELNAESLDRELKRLQRIDSPCVLELGRAGTGAQRS